MATWQERPLWWKILYILALGLGLLIEDVRRLHRRIEWHFLRVHLNKKPRVIKALYHLIYREFRRDMKIGGMSYSLMYGPGKCSLTRRLVCWDAPLGIAVWNSRSPMIAMAIEIRDGFLCIRQLQGVSRRRVPKQARDWPRRFVRACIRFARLSGLKGVRLYRAHTSTFYWSPDLKLRKGESYKGALEAHRQRMRRRYDGTARQMGFQMLKNYGEWLCPPRTARS